MMTCIVHRGPDDGAEWWSADRRVGFGHRRLSIIDLSPTGRQPMLYAGDELVIVFNGEIYNYVDLREELRSKGATFRGASDTEVVMAAYRVWGTDCVTRLNGMFAFALFDRGRNRVFIARDRAGEKPLFYHLHLGELAFASELKSLMASPHLPRLIDHEALDCYLAMGYVPGERCMIRGARKLPPAHVLTFDLASGELNTWRYWSPPPLMPGRVDSEELLDELEPMLEDAVRRQLVAADVPVGVLLSGGVDSSLVTAMAARTAPRVKTFTVRFPGFGPYDETVHARLVARHFGTEHVELEATEASPELLALLARQFDEPMADSSMIPTYLVSQLIRSHCTVALGGDGGDELFGGYEHYRRLLWLEAYVGWVPLGVRRIFGASGNAMPIGLRGRNWLQAVGTDFTREVPPVEGVFDPAGRRALMGRDWPTVAEAIRITRTPNECDLLQRATRMDFANYLAEDILVKVDRASMLASLEVRAPFLDHRIIEFAFGRVPSNLKATPDSLKILLKKLCQRILPPAFDQHRKQGFSIPLASWLEAGPWAEKFREVLLDTGAMFDRSTIDALLQGQLNGRHNSERLFTLALAELWRREYSVAI